MIATKIKNQIVAPFLFEGSCNKSVFEMDLEKVLCPIFRPKQVLIMDNAPFHKSQKIRKLIEEKECVLLYLPPHSPEKKPVEKYWSVLKKRVKDVRKNIKDLYCAILLSLSEKTEFGQS